MLTQLFSVMMLSKIEFVQNGITIPTYRVLDWDGVVQAPDQDPRFDQALLHRMYRAMLTVNVRDSVHFLVFVCVRNLGSSLAVADHG